MRFYRSILLISTVVWFLIGLHTPALHQVTHHGTGLPMTVLAAIVTLIVVGIVCLWALLRAPTRLQRH
jgi:type III secretory pathway component EscU